MKKLRQLVVFHLVLVSAAFMVGCGNYSSSTGSGKVGYGLYDDYYRYPYSPYGYRDYDDVHIHVDRDELDERREQLKKNQPERREKVQASRSRGASMGRPVRTGRGGRR